MDYEYIEGEIAGNKLLYLKNEKQIFCLKQTIKNTKYFDCRIKYCPAKFRVIQDICKRRNEHSHYDDQYFQYIKFKRNLRSQAACEKIRYKNEQSLTPQPKRLSTRNSLTRKSIEKFDESRNLTEFYETTTVIGSPIARRGSMSRLSIDKFDESRDLVDFEEFQELPVTKKLDKKLCVVCQNGKKTHIMVPCGHVSLCGNCTIVKNENGTKNCPVCQCRVDLILKAIF